MFTFLAPLLLKFSGFGSTAKSLVTAIPLQVWQALAT